MPLRRFFLKTRIFGPLRRTVHDAHHAGVGHVRGPDPHLAAVLLDEQHLVERDFLARVAGRAVDGDRFARRYLELPSACLNNRVHARPSLLLPTHQSSTEALLP